MRLWPATTVALCALAISASSLTSAGAVATLAGQTTPRSAVVGTGSWSAVAGSPDGVVFALTTDASSSLYVGGAFTSIGGQPLSRIARWGEPSGGGDDTFTALGAGLDDTVRALAWDDTLYIGGPFTGEVGGVALSGVAAWAQRGADDTYVQLGAGVVTAGGQGPTSSVLSILPTDDTIYFGGEFASASSVADTRRLAGWVDDTWVSVGGGIPNCALAERVLALAALPSQGLAVGGKFRCTGSATEDDTNISIWDGTSWNPMNGGVRPVNPSSAEIVTSIIPNGSTTYVAGEFSDAGPAASPVSVGSIASWDGATWANVGGGLSGACGFATDTPEVFALALDADRQLLYAAGAFCRAGDDTVNSIVVRDLNLDAWVPFVSPASDVGLTTDDTSEGALALSLAGSSVYVGGRFTDLGGVGGPSYLARWTWNPPTGSNAVTASPGQSVTLSGTQFIGVPVTGGVYFGGVPAPSYTRDDTTHISNVVVPGGITGSVSIEVDAVGGRAVVGTLTVPPPPPVPASAPRDVLAAAGDASAVVSWTAPASSGSFAVSNYQVTSSPGGHTCLTTPLSCTVSGLSNGTAYTFTVKALTGAGWSPASAPSNAVTPTPQEIPSITITGSREGRRIEVSGVTTHMAMGAVLRPWVKLAGQQSYTEGSAQILVDEAGTFTWGRLTGKKAYVIVRSEDGSVRSNRVVIVGR